MRDFVKDQPATTAQQQPMAGGGMQAMHNQMKSMPMSGNVDRDFASMMITHHRAAVTMAQEHLVKGQHNNKANGATDDCRPAAGNCRVSILARMNQKTIDTLLHDFLHQNHGLCPLHPHGRAFGH
jgi:porphobilinogen deaminase